MSNTLDALMAQIKDFANGIAALTVEPTAEWADECNKRLTALESALSSALAARVPAGPGEYVTRQSALSAIGHLSLSNSPGREEDAIAMLAAAPPAPAEVAAEPVAWLYDRAQWVDGDPPGGGWRPTVSLCAPDETWVVVRNLTPLVPQSLQKPQQVATQKAQALTAEQIADMARDEELLLICDGLDSLTEIVRCIERAHGIPSPSAGDQA